MAGEVLTLILLLWHWSDGALVCTVTCEEGQYCFQSECRSCPHGTFIDEPVHQLTSCTPWTTRPADSHFVVARDGSSVSDVLWKCQDGYIQSSENICQLVTTTTRSSTSTTTTNRTFLSTVTSTTVSGNHSTGSEANWITWIPVPTLVFLAIIIMVGIVLIKRKHNNLSLTVIVEINQEAVEDKLLANKDGGDQDVRLSGGENCELLFHEIFVELIKSDDDAEKFVRALPDPSGTFQAQNIIQHLRREHLDKETYLLRACMVWARKNRDKAELRKSVCEALEDIERTDVLQRLSQRLDQDKLVCMSGDMVDSSTMADHLDVQITTRGTFKLWHFLAKELGSNDAETLLYRLPNTDQLFNAKNFYEQRKNFERGGFSMSWVDTLEEWLHRNSDCAFLDCIQEILVDMDRSDVLNHPEFLRWQGHAQQGSV